MTDGYAPTGLPLKCNLCQNSDNPCVNLQNDHRRILTVAEITGVHSLDIRPILSCICSRCLLCIESLTETSNLLRSRCTNALRSQNDTQLTPLTAYTSASVSVLHQTLTPSPDIGANHVVLPSQIATTTVVATEPCHTKDVGQGSSIESSTVLSLLEVHHESIVPPLATESVGVYNRTSSNWPSGVPTAEKVCAYCNRSFKRKIDYKQHFRRCPAAKLRYCRSMGNTGCKSIYQDDGASIVSSSSKDNLLVENPCFRCPQCPATFKLMVELKDHTFVHRKQLKCDICGHNSTTQYQFDFHRAECIPKLEVRRENENTTGNLQLPARRKTRSYSVYVSAAAEEKSKDSAMDMTHGQRTKKECLKTSKPKRTMAKQQLPARRMTRSYTIYLAAAEENTPRESADDMINGQSTKKECLETAKPKRAETVAKQRLPARMRRSYSICPVAAAENTSRESTKDMANGQSTKKKCWKTATPKRAKTVTKTDRNRSTEKVDESRLLENQPTPALHHCPSCPVTFQSVYQLWSHMRIHSKLFNCDICRHKYRTQQQLDFHRAKCIKRGNINNVEKQQLPSRRMTSLYTKNVLDIQLISSLENKSKDTVPLDAYPEDAADSIFSRRLSYTNRWLDTHINQTSHSSISLCDETCIKQSFNEDVAYIFKDLNLLDRLRHEVMLKRITCYEPKCFHITSSLNDMMRHDYEYHFKKPWFFCRKCGDCFTSKVFLDYHLDIQDKGHNYLCHKCGLYLPRRHELHRHLLQHEKQSADEVEKLTCYCCNLVFLNQHSLSKHCASTVHNWRNKRQFIHIEYSKTIRNMVPVRDTITYSKKVIEMPTVPLPRQHSLATLKRIGTVEFKEPSIPNCVGKLINVELIN